MAEFFNPAVAAWVIAGVLLAGVGLHAAWRAVVFYGRRWTDAMIEADPFFEPYGDVPYLGSGIRDQGRNSDA